jgi:hypothetical protein
MFSIGEVSLYQGSFQTFYYLTAIKLHITEC